MKPFFRFILLLAALFYLTPPLFAGSATLSASQDAYVRMDRPTNNYNHADLNARKINDGISGENNRAMLQFKYQNGPHINDAMFLLDLLKPSSPMSLKKLQILPAMSPMNT